MFFLIFVISQSLHWRCISAFPIAPVNPNLADLLDNLRQLLICILFCVFSWKTGPRGTDLSFSESSILDRPPRLGWTDSGRVLLCNPGQPHSNTSTKQIFDNSIIIVDEGPRVNAGLALICCSCHLVDLLFEKWVTTVLIWVSIFHCLEPVVCYYFQETWIISCISLNTNFAMPGKGNNSYFYEIFYKDTVIIIWTCKTSGEQRLGTSRMSIVMFAGKSAKC